MADEPARDPETPPLPGPGLRPASDDALLAHVRAALGALGLDPERVAPGSHLVDDLDLDSLDWVDLAQRLEDALAVEIQERPLASVATVSDVVALLRDRLARDPGAP